MTADSPASGLPQEATFWRSRGGWTGSWHYWPDSPTAFYYGAHR